MHAAACQSASVLVGFGCVCARMRIFLSNVGVRVHACARARRRRILSHTPNTSKYVTKYVATSNTSSDATPNTSSDTSLDVFGVCERVFCCFRYVPVSEAEVIELFKEWRRVKECSKLQVTFRQND